MSTLPRALLEDARPATPAGRADAAYEHLRLLLLEGDLGPGDKLSVVALTRQLDCSRVPVMAALKRLEGDGFVRIVPQVGCHVAAPRADDADDFFLLFAAVEGTIARFAALRRTAGEASAFTELCTTVETAAAAAGGPDARDPTYRRLNLLFHGSIHRMARAPAATGVARGLWDRADFFIKVAFGSLYFSNAVRRAHRAIARSIIAGDADAAEAAVRAHLVAVGKRVATALRTHGA